MGADVLSGGHHDETVWSGLEAGRDYPAMLRQKHPGDLLDPATIVLGASGDWGLLPTLDDRHRHRLLDRSRSRDVVDADPTSKPYRRATASPGSTFLQYLGLAG